MLQEFIEQGFIKYGGASVPFNDFLRGFYEWLAARRVPSNDWPDPTAIRAELRSSGLVVGRAGDRSIIGNLLAKKARKKWEPYQDRLRKVPT